MSINTNMLGGRSNDPVPSNGSEYASSPLRVPSMPRSSEPPGAIEAEDADDGAWVSRVSGDLANLSDVKADRSIRPEAFGYQHCLQASEQAPQG